MIKVFSLNQLYIFYDILGTAIYVGKAETGVKIRFYNHKHLPKECYSNIYKIMVADVESAAELEIYESYYINLLKPKFNKKKKRDGDINIKLPELNFVEYKDYSFCDNSLDCLHNTIFEVSLLKNNDFRIQDRKIIKHITPKKEHDNYSTCPNCGGKNIYKIAGKKNFTMRCGDCDEFVGHITNERATFYNPYYCGEYIEENGEIVFEEYYTLIYGKKPYKNYTREELFEPGKPWKFFDRMDKDKIAHTFIFNKRDFLDAQKRLIQYRKDELMESIKYLKDEENKKREELLEYPEKISKKEKELFEFIQKHSSLK